MVKVTRWSVLVAIYTLWILLAANSEKIYGVNPKLYDYGYWIGERLFVITVFWVLTICVEKKYKWVMKILLVVAVWKLIYILLIIFGVIQPNDFAATMGLIFAITISVIILKWPK